MARQTTARRTRSSGGNAAAADDTTNGGAPVSLDDLSPEARAQLLKQAKAEIDGAPATDTDEAAEARRLQLAAEMDPRDHLRDCPMDGRYEAYGDRKPAKPDHGIPAQDVTVIACLECGGRLVKDEAYPAFLARLTSERGED